jgi:hypothetical protein
MAVALRAANLDASPIVAPPPIVPLPEQTFVEAPPVVSAAPAGAMSAADTFIDRTPQAGSEGVTQLPPPPPPKAPPLTAPGSSGKSNRLPIIIGAVALFVLLVVLGITVGPSLFGGGDDNSVVTEADARSGAVGVEEVVVDVEATDSAEKSAATATASAMAFAAAITADAATATAVSSATEVAAENELATSEAVTAALSAAATADGSKSLATATPVDLPTATPTPKPLATATPVPATPVPATTAPDSDGDGILDANDNCPNEAGTSANNGCPVAAKSVRINSITLDGSNYVVNYATIGYTPQLPGEHIHFFFNTVSPDQAGVPGGGPWILYGGPNPFTQYTVGDKPANATQMCALVANSDHSVIQGTGNCVTLP